MKAAPRRRDPGARLGQSNRHGPARPSDHIVAGTATWGFQNAYPWKPIAGWGKPFGFLQHAPIAPALGRPTGLPASIPWINLVAPYGERRWWVNLHDPDGPRHRIVTYQPTSGDGITVMGRIYGDLIAAHPHHPEPKCSRTNGVPCHEMTIGLMARRPVISLEKRYVRKEANELERVEAGLVDELEEVLTIYEQDRWEEVRQDLKTIPVERIMAETGYSRRQVYYLRLETGLRHTNTCRAFLDVPTKWPTNKLVIFD